MYQSKAFLPAMHFHKPGNAEKVRTDILSAVTHRTLVS